MEQALIDGRALCRDSMHAEHACMNPCSSYTAKHIQKTLRANMKSAFFDEKVLKVAVVATMVALFRKGYKYSRSLLSEKEKGATAKSHLLNNAFQHGVTAWRLVTRSALSNFVIVQ